ncbi:unnamed protein product [marine sediment metagenome]|uniref:AMP-dependent synthetase/ligase domain-containing protein n=1 Tax=marine sediment metagenome TaxID=412755 RepID=X1ED12_9ZZZZ
MKWDSIRIETWRDIMEWNTQLYPRKVAFCEVATGRQWTFKEHNEVVNKLCNALYGLGLERGDRVAVLSGDYVEYCQIAMIGKAGLVYVPINWRLTGQEAAYIINESGAKILFVDQDHIDIACSIKNDIPGVKHFICINASPRDMINYYDFIASSSPEDPSVDVEETDILGIPYTSGTTALPKGVVRTHQDVVGLARMLVRPLRYRHDDIYLCVLPLFHVGMLHLQFPQYMIGMTQYIMRFEPKVVMEAIQKYKITIFQAVPTMVIAMTEAPDCPKYDLSSLRVLRYVGSPMPADAARRAWNVFGPILTQTYGTTEGTGLVLLSPEDHARALSDSYQEHILNSAGKPILGCQLKIVDDNDNEVSMGTTGEICLRSKAMVESYWNKPEETAETFKAGWYHTGDMGRIDEEGYVYILDRKKDIIISGGENISARDVENAIYTHPAVLECGNCR